MRRRVDHILEICLLLLFSIMLISVIWQVFSRFVLGSPSTITDEISSYGLVWVGLLGAAYATGKNLHLAIDVLPKDMVSKNRKWFDGFVYLAIALFSISVLVIGGSRLCWVTFVLHQKSAALEIPLGVIYLVLPVSGLLILYYCYEHYRILTNNKAE